MFTKREYERLSKTYEGRQKIKKKYALSALCAAALFLLYVIAMCVADSVFHLQGMLINISLSLGCPAIIVSILISLYYFYSMKKEQKEEIERLQVEAIERKKAEERALTLAFQRAQNERERINKLKESNINAVDYMNGVQFEEFVAAILEDIGYVTQKTRATGDFGADLIVEKNNDKAVVQVKRYSQKVSVSAVQEINTAKNYYGVSHAWVITNNYFTHPAQELALANNVRLIDRDGLIDLIIQAKKARTPITT